MINSESIGSRDIITLASGLSHSGISVCRWAGMFPCVLCSVSRVGVPGAVRDRLRLLVGVGDDHTLTLGDPWRVDVRVLVSGLLAALRAQLVIAGPHLRRDDGGKDEVVALPGRRFRRCPLSTAADTDAEPA